MVPVLVMRVFVMLVPMMMLISTGCIGSTTALGNMAGRGVCVRGVRERQQIRVELGILFARRLC